MDFIKHLNNKNHEKIMFILKKVKKTLVVNDIINQIKKFKNVTSGKSFVDFMEKLEIIQLDHESFGHIKEMANSLAIGKMDTRFPDDFRKDWYQIAMKEKLEDLFLMLRYKRLMEFFLEEKDLIDYYVRTMN